MQDWPVWTLSEANAAVAEVIALTQKAIVEMARLERVWQHVPFQAYDALRGARREDLVRADWARNIAALGVQPKGYFIVDFQSVDPDTLLCWSYGETAITHEHKVWETFIDRRLISHPQLFETTSDEPERDV
jgi:hypothetical protein